MVLNLFRNNNNFTAVTLALYIGLLHLPALAGWVTAPVYTEQHSTGLLYADLFGRLAADPFLSALSAYVLTVLQAIYINTTADKMRLVDDRSWIPGMAYGLLSAALPDFMFLTPPLVAASFVLIGMRRVFSAYRSAHAVDLIFDAAFWTTFAHLFYPVGFSVVVAIYFGFFVMRSFSLKEQIVFWSGVFTACFITWVVYFTLSRGGDFRAMQWNALFGWLHFTGLDTQWIKWFGLGVICTAPVFGYGLITSGKLMHASKCITVCYWLFLIVGVSLLFQASPHITHAYLLIPALAVCWGILLDSIKNRKFAEILHIVLITVILYVNLNQYIII